MTAWMPWWAWIAPVWVLASFLIGWAWSRAGSAPAQPGPYFPGEN